MTKWGRLITAMVTPMDKNREVDYEKAVEIARKFVREGSTALVVNGTTGESPTLKEEERLKLFKVIKEQVNVPIIAGAGTNSTAATIHNAKKAEEQGVDGLLLVTPYYNKPDQNALYHHYKDIAEACSIDIMLYNVPGRTGCNILPETAARLAEIDNIVALKEASGDLDQFAKHVKQTPDDFLVYSGEDSLTLPSLAVGGYGVVSVASHVAGEYLSEMIDEFFNGNVKRAEEIHLKLIDLFDALFSQTNPVPVKAALNLQGLDVGELRQPLLEADNSVKQELMRCMKALNII